MAKDYKKDPTTIKNYNELIEKLKLIDVSPQEAYSLAYKNKFNYDVRHFWTMYRITNYLKSRMRDAVNLKSEYNIEITYPKKIWDLYYKELKEEKWYNNKIWKGALINYKKGGKFWETLWYVDPAYWSDLINAVLENKEIIELIKTKKMPKRIDTCREVSLFNEWIEAKQINFEWIEQEYHKWFPGKKVDLYQEVQNLHKLVTDKRHKDKFSPRYLDIRKIPKWKKIRWQRFDWDEDKSRYMSFIEQSNKNSKVMQKRVPAYAKSTYMYEELNIDDMRYIKVANYLLKNSWYGGKVNQFNYYTQKNINLIR